MKDVIQVIHTACQTEILRVMGRVVGTTIVVGDSDHVIDVTHKTGATFTCFFGTLNVLEALHV